MMTMALSSMTTKAKKTGRLHEVIHIQLRKVLKLFTWEEALEKAVFEIPLMCLELDKAVAQWCRFSYGARASEGYY